MATGAEHYLEAERLLELAEAYIPDGPDHTSCIARAQVHATLALAAAIGVSMPLEIGGEQAMPRADSEAWIYAASTYRARTGGGA